MTYYTKLYPLGQASSNTPNPFANFPSPGQISAITSSSTSMPAACDAPSSYASYEDWVSNCRTSLPECSGAGTLWNFFFDSSSWYQCQTLANQNQIQDVANRAAYYYGVDSPTAQVAQQAAETQKAQVPADVANIAKYYGAGTGVQIPGISATMPLSSLPAWVWPVAIGVGTLMLLNLTR